MEASQQIDAYLAGHTDWRGEKLTELRNLINNTAPELTEGWKWDVPVWTAKTLVCAISSFKDHVKINFFKGASLPDPDTIFNSGLDSKAHRSLNLAETDKVPTVALKNLIKAAVQASS